MIPRATHRPASNSVRSGWRGALAAAALGWSSLGTAAQLTITELEDISLGEVPPSASVISQRIQVCVNMTPGGPFQMVGIGTGDGGAFTLANPAGTYQQITYQVHVGNRRNRAGQALAPGVPSAPLQAHRPLPNGRCHPPFTYITVQVDPASLSAALGGTYRGTLQLTVAPE